MLFVPVKPPDHEEILAATASFLQTKHAGVKMHKLYKHQQLARWF